MADMKISDLPQAANVNDAQQFEVNDGGNSRRVTFQMMREKIKDEFGKPVGPAITPSSWDDLPDQYPHTGTVPVLVRTNASNNGPPGFVDQYFYVQQFFYTWASNTGPVRITQLAIPYTNAQLAFRSRVGDTWTAWRQMLDSINGTLTAAKISDATAVGRAVLKAADQAAALTAIGAGTSNLTLGTTATTAKPGNWKPNINTDTHGQLPYSRLTDVPSTGALPNAYAVGSYAVLAFKSGNSPVAVGDAVGASKLIRIRFNLPSVTGDESIPPYVTVDYGSLSGTWRLMMSATYGPAPALFMRIA